MEYSIQYTDAPDCIEALRFRRINRDVRLGDKKGSKSFPVEQDEHFYHVVRYVQRNELRAKPVRKAEDWRWGSLWRRAHGSAEQRHLLSDWPLP